MNELYVWFSDSHVETISIRCLFIMRLLNYTQVKYKPKYVLLPHHEKSLEKEAREIPLLKYEGEIFDKVKIIQLCKECSILRGVPLTFEDDSLPSRILFEWSTTNLLGLYVDLLYGDTKIRDKVYNDYLSIYKDLTRSDLKKVSESMLQWSIHNRDISCEVSANKELIFEILDGLDLHLEGKTYWFGETPSICDFSLFAFVYMLYNVQMIYFHSYILEKPNLLSWLKNMDKISRNDFSKKRV